MRSRGLPLFALSFGQAIVVLWIAEPILTPRTERFKPSVGTQTKWLQELVAEIFTGAGRLNQPIHIPLRKADEHLWSPVLLRQKYLHFIEDYRI